MKRAWPAAILGVLALSLLTVACGGDDEETPPTTGTATTPGTATATATGTTGTPRPGQPSLDGEEVEHLVNDLVQKVTFGDETVEETVPDLVVRTAGDPDAGRGFRTVALFKDGTWQVTIYMRIREEGAPPDTFLDMQADFYYDEKAEKLTGANGRGQFALTGKNPCSPKEIESGDCELDEPAFP